MDRKDLEDKLRQFKANHLYYMAPIDNFPSILIHGLQSYNRAKGISHASFALESVQSQRGHKMPISNKSIHDYVPLYFATHTPMQYIITNVARTKGRDKVLNQADLGFVEVGGVEVFSVEGTLFTDGNAASSATNFYRDIPDLAKLDWVIIRQRNEYPHCYDKEWKRKKSSEVLVPDCIPSSLFNRIIFYSQEAAENFSKKLAVDPKKLREKQPDEYQGSTNFTVDKTLYF